MKNTLNVFVVAGLLLAGMFSATRTPARAETLTIKGRLIIEQVGDTAEALVLHAVDGSMYLLSGNLVNNLKDMRTKLGDKNLVTITGTPNGRKDTQCKVSTDFIDSETGERVPNQEVRCVPFAGFAVASIGGSEVSDEQMAAPKRDAAKEQQILHPDSNAIASEADLPPIMGSISGTIKAVDIRSPIKSLTIANRDMKSELQELVTLLDPQTQVSKNIGKAEPLKLSTNSLAVGQQVSVIYERHELRSVAKFITITKE